MELQLVSFKQAKALQELGFPQEKKSFSQWYSPTGYPDLYDFMDSLECFAPFLELVAKWLREEKSIEILPQPYSYNHLKERTSSYTLNMWFDDNFVEYWETYNSYEEALSAGIDKAIEMLKK